MKQIYYYGRAHRRDGSTVLIEFMNGAQARDKMFREEAFALEEISESEYLNDPWAGRNVIHVERCGSIAEASSSRTYH